MGNATESPPNHRGYELWGTFSVRDHVRPGAYVAEVLLYDHLVIPVPPADGPSAWRKWIEGDSERSPTVDPREWRRWEDMGWQPQRLIDTLRLLRGTGAVTPVPWTPQWQNAWGDEYRRARSEMARKVLAELPYPVDEMPYAITGQLLQRVTPAMANGVVAVYYESLEDLEEDLELTPTGRRELVPGSMVSAVLGRTLLLPDKSGTSLEALARAAKVAAEGRYRERRRALYEWQRQFLSEAGSTDERSLKKALSEMEKLVTDLEASANEQRSWATLNRAFFVTHVLETVVSAAANMPLALTKAAISVGQYLAGARIKKADAEAPEVWPAALLVDARRELGAAGPLLPSGAR